MGAEADLCGGRRRDSIAIRLRLLDTEITKSVVDGVATGSELPNAPEFTFSSLIGYEWPITGALTANVAFTADYQSSVNYDIIRNPPQAQEGSYWLYDARVGIGSADDKWDIALRGKNLADEQYRTQVIFSSVGLRGDLVDAADVRGDVHLPHVISEGDCPLRRRRRRTVPSEGLAT
jgi:iron complex outermembrane receptor protein